MGDRLTSIEGRMIVFLIRLFISTVISGVIFTLELLLFRPVLMPFSDQGMSALTNIGSVLLWSPVIYTPATFLVGYFMIKIARPHAQPQMRPVLTLAPGYLIVTLCGALVFFAGRIFDNSAWIVGIPTVSFFILNGVNAAVSARDQARHG